MDIETVISFWVKWCLTPFVVVMLGVGYYGSGMTAADPQFRVATACKETQTEATVTITRGNSSRKFEC